MIIIIIIACLVSATAFIGRKIGTGKNFTISENVG